MQTNLKTKEISFTYDFHSDIFISTYLAYNLSNENITEEVKNEYLNFVKEFKYNSKIITDICSRTLDWDTQQKINIQELLTIIEKSSRDIEEKKSMLSGVFNLALRINSKFSKAKNQNKKSNTDLITDIYLDKNQVKNLSITNIDEKIYFDFSNILMFENCYFDSYQSFWDSNNNWNPNTLFKNCEFYNLGTRTSKSILDWKIDDSYSNFDINSQKLMDPEFKKQFVKIETIDEELRNEIEKHIFFFIQFFWRSGHFHAQNISITTDKCKTPLSVKYPKFSNLNLALEEFMKLCDELVFIKKDKYQKYDTINIENSHHWDCKKYIQTKDKPKIVIELENSIFNKLR